MNGRKLGNTDIEVSVVAMGCWAIGGNGTWGPQDEKQAIAAIHTALDVGVNFFDTAEVYGEGRSEELLGAALVGRRHEAIVATKAIGPNLAGAQIPKACEASLKRLQTDVIDLYQIHWPSRTIPLADTVGALEKLRRQGKVRAIGVSNFGVADLAEYLSLGACATNQIPYSLLWRAIEFEIQPKCVDSGVGILPYSPLAQGLLTGKFATPDDVPDGRARTRHFSSDREGVRHGEPGCEAEVFAAIAQVRDICGQVGESMAAVSLAWLLRQPAVVSVLAGARSPDQVKANVRAAEIELADDVLRQLADATDAVKHTLGANPDMWQAEPRIR